MNTGPGQGAHGPSSLPNWWPADPRLATSSTSDVMSQLCRVCGEPAAGFHFGAFTCEGCKSFFGRTYNNLSSISECKNNGECVINKKNRTSCKACRLRKCLVVGMSKSGSRYGRRSNWFKIHCLLQEQQQQHHHHNNNNINNNQHHRQLPHQQQQQQQQLSHQQLLHRPSAGLQNFQQQSGAGCRPSLDQGRTPPLWADVKHHLRLDADNNNSVAGDLNKDVGGRLSVSAAAAAAAVVQAVRPELLRWPSPFFSAFPFPPPAPFFLALQQQQQQQQQQQRQLQQPPTSPPLSRGHRSPRSPSYRSSTADDDSGAGDRDDDDDDDDGPPSSKRVAVHRDPPPVQDSPMDLSVTAAASTPSRPPSLGSPSLPPYVGGRSPGHSSEDQSRRGRRRPRRRRRHPRVDFVADQTSGSEDDDSATGSDSAASSDSSELADGGRPEKNAPLDLTCNRS